jgi:hypothetical protein
VPAVALPLIDCKRDDPDPILYRGQWYCYCDESYGDPHGPASYVFDPPLQFDGRYGIVHANCKLGDAGHACVENLLQSGLCGAHQCAFGNESGGSWKPFVMGLEAEFTAEAVLATLGAHPVVCSDICAYRLCLPAVEEEQELADIRMCYVPGTMDEREAEDYLEEKSFAGAECHYWHLFPEELDSSSAIRDLFLADEDQAMAFYAGSGALNPVPTFVLGVMAPGIVGGFVSSITHT